MAQVLVVEVYEIDIQAQDAKSFTGKNGEKVEFEERKARSATVVLADYDEYRIPLILPEHFDAVKQKVVPGCYLHITCNGLEQLRPLQIKNVNRVLAADAKKK